MVPMSRLQSYDDSELSVQADFSAAAAESAERVATAASSAILLALVRLPGRIARKVRRPEPV